MALKTKGGFAPKAGPKKRAATTERELIERAAEEHAVNLKVKKGRKSSKVNSYRYKDGVTKEVEPPFDLEHQMREPDAPTPFEEFAASLSEDQRVFAKLYWQMQCSHDHEVNVVTNPKAGEVEPVFVRCKDCGAVRKWTGTRASTKFDEWMGYCPEGFDMWEWQTMYLDDKSIRTDRLMWMFVHDEALADMLDESMTKEV